IKRYTIVEFNFLNVDIIFLGKAARGKWKNLKDHFRKEYKRCMTSVDSGKDMSRWPYFSSMMFIKEQILHKTTNPVYLSDIQYQNIYPEVEIGVGTDEDNPLNCLNSECENLNSAEVNNSTCANQDENISDDKHFLLSLIPMFSVLSPAKKLKARIAIETSLLNIAYPDLSASDNSQDEQNGTLHKSSTKAEKRKRMSEHKPLKKRMINSKRYC
ncbi:uncharacterized protein LOC112692304, partial [Sipha flava]|uniref:Uncharacterized protein LOC112692304 n=1 Tax=Sipha flava TaxID=143950 RepID=A0A8B8GJF8_9HEMI